MLDDHQLVPVSAELFQRLSHHNSTADARGLLECALISGYEEAIQNGLTPLDAPLNDPQLGGGPAVAIKKSVTPEYIICLEDGQKFKSLKRHLKTHYDMSPEEYREKWGLPHDYPMVAPAYAAARSDLAKNMGLGRRAVEAVQPVAPAPTEPVAKARGKQTRKVNGAGK